MRQSVDIIKQKKTENDLLDSKLFWERTFDSVPDYISILDNNYKIIRINEPMARQLGVTQQQAIGLTCFECVHGAQQPPDFCPFVQTLADGNEHIAEVHEPRLGGDFLVSTTPLRNEKGEVIGSVHVARNINERKRVEEEIKKSHHQIEIVNQKLQVVGGLTRHDVANKLMIIESNVFLLKKNLKDFPDLLKYTDLINDALSQSRKIFEFGRLYEQIGAEKPQNVDVAAAFDEAAKLLPLEDVKIFNKTQGLRVLADGMLMQLFYNLIDNSIRHGKTVDMISLKYEEDLTQTTLLYEDNGNGIIPENKSLIFSEGFTTGGSGLGLKLVKRMIDVYGWTMAEEGKFGRGARFVINIPKTNGNLQKKFQL